MCFQILLVSLMSSTLAFFIDNHAARNEITPMHQHVSHNSRLQEEHLSLISINTQYYISSNNSLPPLFYSLTLASTTIEPPPPQPRPLSFWPAMLTSKSIQNSREPNQPPPHLPFPLPSVSFRSPFQQEYWRDWASKYKLWPNFEFLCDSGPSGGFH